MAASHEPRNLFRALPENPAEEVFDTILNDDRVRIERIVSHGHASPATGWYDQAQHEWVLVLQGSAVIAYADGEKVSLAVGDHIDIPADTRHRVEWTCPDTATVWLAVHY